jgi:light-regulated signal transduction histidine kinase (bacteriophytochrome)
MVIKGFSGRISEKYGPSLDDRFLRDMGAIQASAQRMEQLINDLLAYARLGKEALQRGRVSMNALVESVLEELRVLYPEGEVIVSPLPHCMGDERMLRLVFVNLVSNAFKFTSRQKNRVIEIGYARGVTENVFFVKDNGAGFDPEHKDKLFNVFQRLHSQEEFSGTGMGLAIVKRIVGLHGGVVWAEGGPGKGATFYVVLPKAEEHS